MLKVQSVIYFLMNTLKKNKKQKKIFPCRGTKISHATRHGQKNKMVCMNEKYLQDLNLKLLRKKITGSIDVSSYLGDVVSCQFLRWSSHISLEDSFIK